MGKSTGAGRKKGINYYMIERMCFPQGAVSMGLILMLSGRWHKKIRNNRLSGALDIDPSPCLLIYGKPGGVLGRSGKNRRL